MDGYPPATALSRPRGPRPPPHSRRLVDRSSPSTSPDFGAGSRERRHSYAPDLISHWSDYERPGAPLEQSVSSGSLQSWKPRYTNYATFRLDLDVQPNVHMDRAGGVRRVILIVDDEDLARGSSGSGLTSAGPAQGVPSTSVSTEALAIDDSAGGMGAQVNAALGEAMVIDTESIPNSAGAVSTHSSMPGLVSFGASELGQERDDADFLELFDLYTDFPHDGEAVTAEEIYASRLFDEDEILLDPEEEARIRAIWAEVDRIRMPIPSDGGTESDWNSEDEMKYIADEARDRREFPNFYIPDLPSHMCPPSDSDETDIDFDDEDWDTDDMFTRVTGLNNIDEYDALQTGFQNELASRDMARDSDAWYTPLTMESPGANFGADVDGETLFDLQSFLNLESPGFDNTGNGVGRIILG